MTATTTERPGALSHRSDSMSGVDMRRRGLILLAGAVGIVLTWLSQVWPPSTARPSS